MELMPCRASSHTTQCYAGRARSATNEYAKFGHH